MSCNKIVAQPGALANDDKIGHFYWLSHDRSIQQQRLPAQFDESQGFTRKTDSIYCIFPFQAASSEKSIHMNALIRLQMICRSLLHLTSQQPSNDTKGSCLRAFKLNGIIPQALIQKLNNKKNTWIQKRLIAILSIWCCNRMHVCEPCYTVQCWALWANILKRGHQKNELFLLQAVRVNSWIVQQEFTMLLLTCLIDRLHNRVHEASVWQAHRWWLWIVSNWLEKSFTDPILEYMEKLKIIYCACAALQNSFLWTLKNGSGLVSAIIWWIAVYLDRIKRSLCSKAADDCT